MGTSGSVEVEAIEVIEDLTARSRCDEGFLQVRRLRCQNRRADGSLSEEYRVDVIDRPRLDAVAVLIYRWQEGELEVLTRQNLRPAAFFRKDKVPAVPDPGSHLFVEEIVAGLLEPADQGEEGIRRRAAAEALEEGGVQVRPSEVKLLGGPFFVAPGILSEKIHLASVDATGRPQQPPRGDGSPLEEGGATHWWSAEELLRACVRGEIQDAKTEIGVARLLVEIGGERPYKL
jgi:ADP-ribose pyrophosphatase